VYTDYFASASGYVMNWKTGKLIGYVNGNGYIRCTICHNGERMSMQAHRFVYECINGVITDKSLVINHIDECRTNNAISNLELVTCSENNKKATRKSTGLRGSIPCQGKQLNDNNWQEYESMGDAARQTTCQQRCISDVCHGVQDKTIDANGNEWTFRLIA
jgi:hypothetical protein